MTNMLRWIIGAIIGGLIGASVWAAITYFTGYEVGWIAWGVGFVVGLGVRIAAGTTAGFGPGGVAAVGALAALLAGKYAAVQLLIKHELKDVPAVSFTADDMKMDLASEVAAEWRAAGKTLNWPAGQSGETAESSTDFPPEVVAEAAKRWDALSADDQQKQIAEKEAMINDIMGAFQDAVATEGFKASFSPMDLLFFGLAIFIAFKVGSGAESS